MWHMCVNVCTCVSKKNPEEDVRFFLYHSMPFASRQGLSMTRKSRVLARLAILQALRRACLCPPVLEAQVCVAMPGFFYKDAGDLNSDPHACRASSLTPWPVFPTPCVTLPRTVCVTQYYWNVKTWVPLTVILGQVCQCVCVWGSVWMGMFSIQYEQGSSQTDRNFKDTYWKIMDMLISLL